MPIAFSSLHFHNLRHTCGYWLAAAIAKLLSLASDAITVATTGADGITGDGTGVAIKK